MTKSKPLHKTDVECVLQLLSDDPEGWEFTNCEASYRKKFSIWVANSSYADMNIGPYGNCAYGPRLGNWWSRRKLRKALSHARVMAGILQRLVEELELENLYAGVANDQSN